jgi:hypothetical protein
VAFWEICSTLFITQSSCYLRRIGQTEADGRLLWIRQAQKRMNGQVGLEEGLGAHNSHPEIVPALSVALIGCLFPWSTVLSEKPQRREGAVKRRCITNGTATQPYQPHRDGERAQPCIKSRDGDGWRSGSQEGKSLEYRNDTPRISDIYAILKWLKHMKCITCNHWRAVMIRFSIER